MSSLEMLEKIRSHIEAEINRKLFARYTLPKMMHTQGIILDTEISCLQNLDCYLDVLESQEVESPQSIQTLWSDFQL